MTVRAPPFDGVPPAPAPPGEVAPPLELRKPPFAVPPRAESPPPSAAVPDEPLEPPAFDAPPEAVLPPPPPVAGRLVLELAQAPNPIAEATSNTALENRGRRKISGMSRTRRAWEVRRSAVEIPHPNPALAGLRRSRVVAPQWVLRVEGDFAPNNFSNAGAGPHKQARDRVHLLLATNNSAAAVAVWCRLIAKGDFGNQFRRVRPLFVCPSD